MILISKDIDLFKDLSLLEINGKVFDLHNDYKCIEIDLKDDLFKLRFKDLDNKKFVEFHFFETRIAKYVFKINNRTEPNDLSTVDTLYRGRFERLDQLFEFSENGASYWYLGFVGDLEIEFFCTKLELFILD